MSETEGEDVPENPDERIQKVLNEFRKGTEPLKKRAKNKLETLTRFRNLLERNIESRAEKLADENEDPEHKN